MIGGIVGGKGYRGKTNEVRLMIVIEIRRHKAKKYQNKY